MPQKFLFIINNHSGNKDINWHDEINGFFKNKGFELDFYDIASPPDCDAIKKYIQKSAADKVVAIGGDGTITLIADMLKGTKTPLGIVPGGSANGMAKELGIRNNIRRAFEVIENGTITPVDTILINEKYTCLHLSDIGVNAQLIKNFEDGGQRGQIGYAKVALKTLREKKRLRIELRTSKGILRKAAIMVVIANAAKYGTGAIINPDSAINDQRFEVLVIKRIKPITIIRMLLGKKFKPENIETIRCSSIEIAARQDVHFQVDGEYVGQVKKVTARIEPHSIQLILPENK